MKFQDIEPYMGKTIRMKYSFKKLDFGKNVRVINNLTGVIVELHRMYFVFQMLHSEYEVNVKPKDVIKIKNLI